MGAVRMRVQAADKKHHNNPQIIPMTPSINILWSKKQCVCKKLYLFAFCCKKVVLSESGDKYPQMQKQSKIVQNK